MFVSANRKLDDGYFKNVYVGGDISIIGENNEKQVILGSSEDGGRIALFNPAGTPLIGLSGKKSGGEIIAFNNGGIGFVSMGIDREGDGILVATNKEGIPGIGLFSSSDDAEGSGGIVIYNKYSKAVATIQSNKDEDGAIALYDRYGDIGWGETGKK